MIPCYDVVLIKEIKEDSLIITSESRSEIAKGIVEAVGPGQLACGNERAYVVSIRVKVGQTVYYIRDHALKIKDLWAVKEKEIICVE